MFKTIAAISLAVLAVASPAQAAERALQDANPVQDFVLDINDRRTAAGLSTLCVSTKLKNAADDQAYHMATTNSITTTGADGSTPTSRAKAQGFNFTSGVGVTERVAAGYATAEHVLAAWSQSSAFNSTVLDPAWTHIGPGYSFNNDTQYKYYWVVDLGISTSESCDGLVW